MEIILALISMCFLSAYELLYKKVANKGIKSENIFINTFLFSGIFKMLLVCIFFLGSFQFSIKNFIIYLPNIIFDLLAAYLFIKSLKRIPIFLTSTLYLIYYPFSIICSVLFLNEKIDITKIIAIIIIGGIILILSLKGAKNKGGNKNSQKEHLDNIPKGRKKHLDYISKGILFAISAGVLNALYMLLDKNCLNIGMNPNEIILYNGIGSVIISLIFYYKISYDSKISTSDENKYTYTLTPTLLIAIALRFLSSVLYTVAMSYGNVSTVIPIIASDVIVITIISNLFLNEKTKLYQKVLIVMFFACILMLTI